MDWDRYDHAKALRESGRTEEALSELKSLANTSNDPLDNAIVWLAIANCLRYLRRPEDARRPLREAYSILDETSELYPRVMFVEALVEENLGNWQKELTKLDEILGKYAEVLQQHENQDLRGEVHRHRGIALLGLGRYAEACPLLEGALPDDYEKQNTLYFLGQCLFELGDLQQAKQRFTEALSLGLAPGYELDTHYRLGVIHYRVGEHAWARQEFEWCFEHVERGGIPKDQVLRGLIETSKALGMERDAESYSKLLKQF